MKPPSTEEGHFIAIPYAEATFPELSVFTDVIFDGDLKAVLIKK